MKVIIAGGRNFKPTNKHDAWLKSILLDLRAIEIVCGRATGADLFGKQVGESLNIPIKEFPADWDIHGKGAGPIRNKQMADYADCLILFPGGSGSKNMKDQATSKGLIVIEWED